MKFCTCGNMLSMFDNIEERVLYYYCQVCDSKHPFETNLILQQTISKISKNWVKYDKTLPLSDKKCFKCFHNVVYEKNPDLTLKYFCTNCNETWI